MANDGGPRGGTVRQGLQQVGQDCERDDRVRKAGDLVVTQRSRQVNRQDAQQTVGRRQCVQVGVVVEGKNLKLRQAGRKGRLKSAPGDEIGGFSGNGRVSWPE